ncbi:hypothetical protein CDL12_14087 [Handroanthus impetiginosus]|uniref:Uncharacterized protein n=1 Tax=Handroanthus impetiginosus TaxID=429701 RepID=A0A2G9H6Z9_9LAMI|nr:hypothetical protein CDL12_14087 [Handroanthus impetiginosus]
MLMHKMLQTSTNFTHEQQNLQTKLQQHPTSQRMISRICPLCFHGSGHMLNFFPMRLGPILNHLHHLFYSITEK